MFRYLFIIIILFQPCAKAFASADSSLISNYHRALVKLDSLMQQSGSFKEAVFTVENAYFDNKLDRQKFLQPIDALKSLCLAWGVYNKVPDYHFSDSIHFQKNYSIYAVLKDTTKIIIDSTLYAVTPYVYDFSDYNGVKDWTSMFVSKLLITKKGNCHSLPFLYKILADEIGANCWLSLAPNHMYIKNRCKAKGWYNVELSSGTFPVDAWIMGSGYVSLEAVQQGIFMDTLSNRESIALCVLDLAKGYERRIRNYDDGFILRCCDVSLRYFPRSVQAMLLKAETLKRMYDKQCRSSTTMAKKTYEAMEAVYTRLIELGYREMPEQMYQKWLLGL